MTKSKKTSHHAFSIETALKTSWQIFKKKWGFLLGAAALVFIVNWLTGIAPELVANIWPLAILVTLAGLVINMILQMGVMRIYIKAARKEKVEIADLWADPERVLQYFLGLLVVGLITVVGFVLLIIPGVYLSLKYMFVPYLIIDKNMGPLQAMKASGKMTKGVKLTLFLFALVLGGLNILGLLALIIGLFITIPITYLAIAYSYNFFLKKVKK